MMIIDIFIANALFVSILTNCKSMKILFLYVIRDVGVQVKFSAALIYTSNFWALQMKKNN